MLETHDVKGKEWQTGQAAIELNSSLTGQKVAVRVRVQRWSGPHLSACTPACASPHPTASALRVPRIYNATLSLNYFVNRVINTGKRADYIYL